MRVIFFRGEGGGGLEGGGRFAMPLTVPLRILSIRSMIYYMPRYNWAANNT